MQEVNDIGWYRKSCSLLIIRPWLCTWDILECKLNVIAQKYVLYGRMRTTSDNTTSANWVRVSGRDGIIINSSWFISSVISLNKTQLFTLAARRRGRGRGSPRIEDNEFRLASNVYISGNQPEFICSSKERKTKNLSSHSNCSRSDNKLVIKSVLQPPQAEERSSPDGTTRHEQ